MLSMYVLCILSSELLWICEPQSNVIPSIQTSTYAVLQKCLFDRQMLSIMSLTIFNIKGVLLTCDWPTVPVLFSQYTFDEH